MNSDTLHWGLGNFAKFTLDPSGSGLRSPRGDSTQGPELVEGEATSQWLVA